MQFIVSSGEAGQPLDHFLAGKLPDVSRSQVQRLIRGGCVRLNAGQVKPALVVEPGLRVDVEIPAPAPAAPTPEPLPLKILYDDPDIVVVDKPAGMVVHPA